MNNSPAKSENIVNIHKKLLDNSFTFARNSIDGIKTKTSTGTVQTRTLKGKPVPKPEKKGTQIKHSFNNEYEIITLIKKK